MKQNSNRKLQRTPKRSRRVATSCASHCVPLITARHVTVPQNTYIDDVELFPHELIPTPLYVSASMCETHAIKFGRDGWLPKPVKRFDLTTGQVTKYSQQAAPYVWIFVILLYIFT